MKFLNYIAVSLAIFTMASCDDNVEAVRTGGDNDKLTIQHQFGKNLVGRVTVDGVPREGVVVSDGITVMTTDANGEYQMYTTGRQHVFISVPEDCEVPVFNGHPKFYKTLDFSNDAIIQRDFQLRSCNKKTEWTLFTMADVQIGNGDVNDYSNVVMPQILDFTQTLTNNAYGINVGDIVWNTPSLFETYKSQVAKTLIPTFNVIGNHDHNEGIKNDTESDRDYRNALGPTYYSVNIGDCHLVVLDDVLYRGIDGRNDYSGTITQAQLDWLEKDLSYVSKDKMIIIGVHIPTKRRNRSTQLTNNQALYDLVKDFKEVQILSGHTHNNFTTTIADNITETTFGAVMGAYWYPLCNDGSPRGYAVLKFNGNRLVDKYYRGAATPRDYQMEIYPPSEAVMWQKDAKAGDPYDKILVNIFAWHSTWTVEIQEDGGAWTTLSDSDRLVPTAARPCWDPRIHLQVNEDGVLDANHGGSAPENYNDHMFLYKPASSWKNVTVRATDPFGNVYTSSLDNK